MNIIPALRRLACNKLLTGIVVCAVCLLPLSRSEATSFTTGLVAHWNMDEGGGTDMLDSSGNSNNGTINGATFSTEYAPTIFENASALSFDGTNDYVSVPLLDFSAGHITISAWVKANDITTTEYSEIMRQEDDATNFPDFLFAFQNNGAKLSFGLFAGGTYDELDVTITAANYTDGWHHLVAVYDGATKKIYKDGVEIGSNSDSGTIAFNGDTNDIGAFHQDGSVVEFLNGNIDDVRMYNRALSPEEVSVLAAEKSLVGYWKFDELSGTTAADSSGMGNNGELTDGPTISSDVPTLHFNHTRSLSFDGTDDYVEISDTDKLTPPGSYSVSFWVKVDSYDDTYTSWVSKWGEIGNQREFGIGEDSTGGVTFYHSVDAAGSIASIGVVRPSTGTWHHFAGVFTSGEKVELFLNGNSVGDTSTTSEAVINGTAPLRIGGSTEFGGNSGYFDGKIDDVRIFNRALSSAEIGRLAVGHHPTATWTGEHSIYFEDPFNWDTGFVPDPYSKAVFDDVGARPILTDDVSLAGLTINSSASFDLKDNDFTMLDSGEFSNNGTLILDGTQTIENLGADVDSGKIIYRGASDIASLPTGNYYNDLRIEDPTEHGLVGYWKLDEGSGSTTLDLSGNGYDADLVGGPTFSATVGSTNFYNPRSLEFDGTNYAVANGVSTVSTTFSVSGFFRMDANGLGTLIDHRTPSTNDGWRISAKGFGSAGHLMFTYGGVSDYDITSGANPMLVGVMNYFSVVVSGGTATAYWTTTPGGTLHSASVAVGSMAGSPSQILLGTGNSGAFTGLLDDMRIYNRALSANEVANLARGRYAAGSVSTATYTTDSSTTIDGTLSLDSGNLSLGDATTIQYDFSLLRGNGSLILGSADTSFGQSLTLSGGTITGGAGDLNVQGNVSILTGSLLAPSGEFRPQADFTKTGGTFSHNNGTLLFQNLNQSLTSGGAEFNEIAVYSTVTLQDALTAEALGIESGTLDSNDQDITLGTLVVNGGTFEGSAGALDLEEFHQEGGTFHAPQGLFTVSEWFSQTDGDFLHESSSLVLNPTADTSINVTDPFNDLYINDGLVGYWNFDETAGTSAADSSGYRNTGTHTNGPTISTDVPDVSFTDARSLSFDGTDDYVVVSNSAVLSSFSSGITISAWINPGSFPSGGYPAIVEKTDDYGTGRFHFMVCNDCKGIHWGFGANANIPVTNILSADEWQHVTLTYDKSNVRIYVDGVLEETDPFTGEIPVTSQNLRIGTRTNPSTASDYFNGNIDDVRIYNRALSADEIARLAAGNQPATSIATVSQYLNMDIEGDLYLNSGTLEATGDSFSVAGDWKNNGGIFDPNTETVVLDGTNQSIPSSETFYNLTKSVSSADTLTFGSGSTTTVTGTLELTGVASNLLSLRSSTTGQQWKINPQGTRTLAYLDVKDSKNINATGITTTGLNITNSGNNTNWNFDSSAPTISSFSPADGATSQARDVNLTIEFSEDITAVAARNITIKNLLNHNTIETIAANGAQVTISGSTVTINPSVTIPYSTPVYVLIDSGAFVDAFNNEFAGITSDSTWNVTIIDEPFTPSSESSSTATGGGSGGGGGGGGRGTAGPGGRSTQAEAIRQALVDRFKSQVASDEVTVPPKGSSSRSSRPTIVKGSSSSATQTAQTSSAPIVTQDRGHLKVQDGVVAVLYKDVPVDAWFAPYVSLLIEENIAQGYKDEAGKPKGEFGVTNPVTYAELAKMVLEAADKDLKKAGTPRNLTAKGTWASPYIALAESLQMTVYTPSLNVMQPATRGEVIQSILEAFNIPVKAKNIATFTDLPEGHPHAQAIGVAYLYGLIDGDTNPDGTPKGTVRPDDQVNRAEVAKIIALALKLL